MTIEEQNAVAELRKAAAKWSTITKAVWFMLLGAFTLGVWVATLEYRQRLFEDNQNRDHDIVATLDRWRASTESSRWTIQDQQRWSAADLERETSILSSLAEQSRLQELRIQRLEDNQQRVVETQTQLQRQLNDRLSVTPKDVLEELQELAERLARSPD